MVFQVKKGDTITEYELLDIDRVKLEGLKAEIIEKYSTVTHCEYIDHSIPMESSTIRNLKVEQFPYEGQMPLFKIEADVITLPRAVDAINGTLIGSGKGLTDLMALDATRDALMAEDILSELRHISNQYKDDGSIETIVAKVVNLSKKVTATEKETQDLYDDLKSCITARVRSVYTLPKDHTI